jgi:Alternate to MurJ
MELADLFQAGGSGINLRTARVISVAGSTVTVDLGGAVTVKTTDGCNPVPEQTVILALIGQSIYAVGALNGPYRQASITATSSTSTTVTGLINGVSTVIPKTSTATVVAGEVLPILWSADGFQKWAISKEADPTLPPPVSGGGSAGGGSGGGGGVVAPITGTTYYSPTNIANYNVLTSAWAGFATKINANKPGAFFYGNRRFAELQGRTITACYIALSGGGARAASRHNRSGPVNGSTGVVAGIGTITASGNVNLGAAVGAALVAGTGTAGIYLASGVNAISGGRLRFDWRL